MVCIPESKTVVQKKLQHICDEVDFFHLDDIETGRHQHIEPDVRISIHCAGQIGIVTHATDVLNKAGLNILNLELDLGGSQENPLYVIPIEGVAGKGFNLEEKSLQVLAR
jgi:glycine cleavage system transcriptional repressor